MRQKHLSEALASLKRAMELAPDDARFSYVYAVALHGAGHTREAKATVETALKRAPGDPALNELRSQLAAEVHKR